MTRPILTLAPGRMPDTDADLKRDLLEAMRPIRTTMKDYHAERARTRHWLYHNDPIYRLTKLKDNWERRERKRRAFNTN